MPSYDAVLIVSFGGPEGPDEVLPFLENVLFGKNVPRARMLEVAEHYYHFGGISPINAQNRALKGALEAELKAQGPPLPVYWGNRNWRPLLADTLGQMAADGLHRALALVTSAFGSYSSCRQYLEDIERARQVTGENAPRVDKLRAFYNHPGFIETMIERVEAALEQLPREHRAAARLIYTAHSIPLAMAAGGPYVAQLQEAAGLVSNALISERSGRSEKSPSPVSRDWELVYQSRSGPPGEPWLEPDIGDVLPRLQAAGAEDVVVVPLGFLSDHLEVLYDLDVQAADIARSLGLNLVRAGTVGDHPKFVRMVRDLIVERMTAAENRPALGRLGARPDVCPADCCPPPARGPRSV